MRGLRVAVVLFVGCGGAVAVTESGGDGGSATPEASVPYVEAGESMASDATASVVDASLTSDASTGADSKIDGDASVNADASDAGVDMDSGADSGSDAGKDAGTDTVVQVASGRRYTCFVMSTGKLYCAGNGASTPTLVAGITDAVEVSVGGSYGSIFWGGRFWGGGWHICARRAGGTVECWGANDFGQLGDGTRTNRAVPPAPVTGLSDAVQISAGLGNSTCARRATGAVVCWGANIFGELGGGGAGSWSTTPIAVAGLTDATDLSAGLWGACAVRATGQVLCWGDNDRGQLGSSGPSTGLPMPVPGMTDAIAVARGSYFAHAIRADGSVWGWGSYGPWIGDGAVTVPPVCPGKACVTTPPVAVGITATKISSNAGVILERDGAVCALRPNGSVSCWGTEAVGELGDGPPYSSKSAVPVDVLGIHDATGISLRGQSGCALRSAGRVSCWGLNSAGQLGDGTTTTQAAPVDVVW